MPNKTDGIRKFFSGLNRSEPYLFFVVVLLNAWPLFTCKFFLTQDGPSHIYNSVLLRELIFGNDLSIHHVFSLNHELVPNMISHMLMATASCFLPAWMAEKIVLLIYFIGLPYVFRFFLSKSSAPEIFLSALIIPFTYSYFFYLGFYNFLLALIPFFMVLTIWTSANKKINLRFILKFFLWLMLLYFSHLYVFVLALLLMGLHTCLEFRRDRLKFLLRDLFFLLLISMPMLLLLLHFISHTPINKLNIQPSFHELARALSELSCLNRPGDFVKRFTSKIGLIFALLLLVGMILRVIRFRKKEQKLFLSTDNWLIAAFILLCLYFSVPDYIGGGMNCLRIQQLMVICIIVWIALQIFPRWISGVMIVCVLFLQFHLVCFYSSEKNHSNEITEWMNAGKQIEKGTLTLPIVFTDDDLWAHSSGYLGASSSLALYANYEAGLQWFPVIWNNNYMIRLKGLKNRNPLTDDRNPAIVWMNKPILYPDNVIIWDQPKNKSDSISFHPIDSLLKIDYKLTFQSQNLKLFKQNK